MPERGIVIVCTIFNKHFSFGHFTLAPIKTIFSDRERRLAVNFQFYKSSSALNAV